MPRLPRLHVPNGLYYVVLRADGDREILLDADDFRHFSARVAASLRSHRCRLHAFCWIGDQAHLALQITDVPVGRFVQHVTARYANYVHHKHQRRGHLFAHHHRAVLTQRRRYLPHLVRHIHRVPVRAGLVKSAAEYEWSSDSSYRGESKIAWLTTHVTRDMLDTLVSGGPQRYERWMEMEEDPEVAQVLEVGCKKDPRVLGDEEFIAAVTGRVLRLVPERSLNEIVERVIREQGVTLHAVLSPSRRRQHVLARALIAWHATQEGAATLTQVGQKLRRDPSTLWVAMERYRKAFPDLFAEKFAELCPEPWPPQCPPNCAVCCPYDDSVGDTPRGQDK